MENLSPGALSVEKGLGGMEETEFSAKRIPIGKAVQHLEKEEFLHKKLRRCSSQKGYCRVDAGQRAWAVGWRLH